MSTRTPIAEAVQQSHRRGLEAMRDLVAEHLDDVTLPVRVVPALARRLQSILAELDRLADPVAPASQIELLQARRASRLRGQQREVDALNGDSA